MDSNEIVHISIFSSCVFQTVIAPHRLADPTASDMWCYCRKDSKLCERRSQNIP